MFTFVFAVCSLLIKSLVADELGADIQYMKRQLSNNLIKFYGIEHHNYEKMVAYLENVNKECPDISRIYSIGNTNENRKMLVMEMSINPGKEESLKPDFKYVGNMHGNEVVGREVLLYLLKDICLRYKASDKYIISLLEKTRIHIMPSMNPDGYERSEEGDCYSVKGRPNSNMQDLNRDFPDQFDPPSKRNRPESELQIETRNVIDWLKQYSFVLSANLHGGSLVANYPFDDDAEGVEKLSLTPDNDVFEAVALAYSEAHPRMRLGRPCGDDVFLNGITNGAKWYNVLGGMQDYNYLHSNSFEITVELDCCKFPVAAKLPGLWKENINSLYAFMNQVHTGVKGQVRHANGSGIAGAKIEVTKRNEQVYRQHPIFSRNNGDFFHLLLPGDYLLKVTAGGHDLEAAIHVSDRSSEEPLKEANVYNFVVNDNAISAIHTELMQREVNIPLIFKDAGATKVESRSDNVAAAVVIVTIGCIVCILAGIVLYRKVKELRTVQPGGYSKIDPEKFVEEP